MRADHDRQRVLLAKLEQTDGPSEDRHTLLGELKSELAVRIEQVWTPGLPVSDEVEPASQFKLKVLMQRQSISHLLTRIPAGEVMALQHRLSGLPCALDALEPHVSKETLSYHHGKHHAGDIKKLNTAVENTQFVGKSLK